MPNHLIHETSPYLLQHAHNPVDWYPWGSEALQKAQVENKPIFLSIGYSACHWCHVMERESFTDPDTAALLNQYFIAIKVDREERPDLDSIYMSAVVALTRRGGWPMSIFLTPEMQPFYGGTYFPPAPRYGMPSFQEVLASVQQAWQNDHQQVMLAAQHLSDHLRTTIPWSVDQSDQLDSAVLEKAATILQQSQDHEHGGWGNAPKFPQPMAIEFLLQRASLGDTSSLHAAEKALLAMQRGGMYDVVGGGFHRYSTDDIWLIPHFEKMLYDNAQLSRVYLHAWQLTQKVEYLQVCTQTLDWIIREMRHPSGGFFSSLDADSEGVEGKFYIWEKAELQGGLAPKDFNLLQSIYHLPNSGNFEGKIILQRRADLEELACTIGVSTQFIVEEMGRLHQKLFALRALRTRPQTDDKIIVSWNAFTLQTFAEAARALNRADYLQVAQQNAGFLLQELRPAGSLLRSWRNGQARHPAVLEDCAGLILGLLSLYQTDFDPKWYQAAQSLAEELITQYTDPQGGFFDTPDSTSDLLLRPKDLQDNATPSGNALATHALLCLSAYSDTTENITIAGRILSSLQENLSLHPLAFSYWLQAFHFAVSPVRQIAIVWPSSQPEPRDWFVNLNQSYRPFTILAGAPLPLPENSPALFKDRPLVNGQAAIYHCQNFTCSLPVTDLHSLNKLLAE